MESISLVSLLYQQLPLDIVARHEAGHAVMAHCCGGYVKRILLGTTASGEHFGRAFWAVPSIDEYLLVLSGGALALYLHERPSEPTFEDFCAWVSTLDGQVKAVSGISDWSEILRRTDQPDGFGIEDFLDRAVRPYFDKAIAKLAKASDQLDGLTELVLAQPPGIGRRSLQRFFAGRPPSRWAERLDRPHVLWGAHAEMRSLALAA
jgi:hypothetical protein